MINEYDVLAMMQDGDTADQVAQKLADALNKGKVLFAEEEQKRKDYEAEQAKQRRTSQIEDLDAILDQLYDFFLTYYVEDSDDEASLAAAFKDVNATAILDYIEQLGAIAKALSDFTGFNLGGEPKVSVKFVDPTQSFSNGKVDKTDETIQKFLKSIGL